MTKNKSIGSLAVLVLTIFSANAEIKPGSIYDLPAKFTTVSGEKVALSQWKGTPIVITMTYTSCEYACPRIIEKLKNVQKHFSAKKRHAQFIVATFDPVRDTPKKLKAHKGATGEIAKDWQYLSGTEADLRQLSMVLGIRFERNPEDGNISHDNKILITNDKGEIIQELNGLNSDVSEIK